jgi:hypothetical protein
MGQCWISMPPVLPKCLELLGMHALSGCDTVSYPYGKGKISALKTLLACRGLPRVGSRTRWGRHHTDCFNGSSKYLFHCFILSATGDINGICSVHALHENEESPQNYGLIPPTSANLLQHVLRAHLQVMLWKAADQQAPPDESNNRVGYPRYHTHS